MARAWESEDDWTETIIAESDGELMPGFDKDAEWRNCKNRFVAE